jgi:ABC-type phosphate/phosphonate transport system substrate-binding protein
LSGTRLVASLPMYDWPEVKWAHDALWELIRARLRASGIAAPETLDRTRPFGEAWLDPGLVLSQTCGYPFSTRLIGKVRLVGTPVYAVEGCDGPYYSTFIVARRGKGEGLPDFRGRRFAMNSADSLSGYIAFRVAMREAGFDPDSAKWVETGGHRASIRAVAAGEADIASIDAIVWALAQDHEREAVAKLAVVARTPLRPGLPLLTSAARSPEEIAHIRTSIHDALADSASEAPRAALHLADIAMLAEADYAPLADLMRR